MGTGMELAIPRDMRNGQALVALFDSVDQARSALRGLSNAGIAGLELRPVAAHRDTAAHGLGDACMLSIDVQPGEDKQRIIELMRRNGARRIEERPAGSS